jgi:acyl carrier protein
MQGDIKTKIKIREDCFNQVAKMLISALKLNKTVDEMDPDTPLFATGLGLDSVDAVVIIVELESKFKISISEDEGRAALRTINTIVDLVVNKLENES